MADGTEVVVVKDNTIAEGTEIEGGIIPAQEKEILTPEQERENALQAGIELERQSGVSQLLNKIDTLKNEGRHDEVALVEQEIVEFNKQYETPEVKQEETPEVEQEEETELTPEQQEIADLKAQLEALKNPEVKQEETPEVTPDDEIKEKLNDAGIKYDDVYNEHVKTGTISEETLKGLEKAGFSKDVVQAIVDTKMAQAQEVANTMIADVCGGQEGFDEMSQWMTETMTDEQLDEYNVGVESPHAKVYLQNAMNAYRNAHPVATKPVTVRGNRTQITTADEGYKNQAEMSKDMNDMRYRTDPAFRAKVHEKTTAFYSR